MRFAFCGGLACPEWVLGEVATISRLSSVRIKLLVMQVAKRLTTGAFDAAKVAKLVGESSLLEPSDARAAVAALHHIVERAARHDTAPDTLRRELLQLGMPKESAEAIVRPYAANLLAVREKAAQMGWLLPTLPDETDEAKGALAWRVEHRLACGGDLPAGGGVASDFTALLHLRAAEVGAASAGNDEKATGASGYTFEATRDDVILLLYELKQARAAAQHATQD